MNEGAREANAARQRHSENYDRDLMLKKLDRMIALLERIEVNTRPFMDVYTQTETPCTCGQTVPCRKHHPTLTVTTTTGVKT